MRVDRSPHLDMNVETVESFCKDASRTFLNKVGLISHQINSFDPSSDCSNPLSLGQASIGRTGAGRYTTITYEKVRLYKPSFWTERDDHREECL